MSTAVGSGASVVDPKRVGIRKLGLGTVQFGLRYGATNLRGVVERSEVERILAFALDSGVDTFDTASAYGDAQSILGRLLPADARIVTKLSVSQTRAKAHATTGLLRDGLEDSLRALARDTVYGLLLHTPEVLADADADEIATCLLSMRDRGLAEKVGVSAYSAEQLRSCVGRYPFDLYQVPLNVLDQRLVVSGMLRKLSEAGAEIHARSVFLQGVLVASPTQLPSFFDPWRERITAFGHLARQMGAEPLGLALSFVRSRSEVDCAIVGVTSVEELSQVVAQCGATLPPVDWSSLAVEDEALLNPSNWPAFKH